MYVPPRKFQKKDAFPSLPTSKMHNRTSHQKGANSSSSAQTAHLEAKESHRTANIEQESGGAPRKAPAFRTDHTINQAKRAENRDSEALLLTKDACRESTDFLAEADDGIGGFPLPPPPPSLSSSISSAAAAGSLVASDRVGDG